MMKMCEEDAMKEFIEELKWKAKLFKEIVKYDVKNFALVVRIKIARAKLYGIRTILRIIRGENAK